MTLCIDFDSSLMMLHDFVADAQAKPHSTANILGGIKWIEDPSHMLIFDTSAVVTYQQMNPIFFSEASDFYAWTFGVLIVSL